MRTILIGLFLVITGNVHAERTGAELDAFVRNECGFCHGLRLTGGIGTPLTPPALAGKSDGALLAAILAGVPNTPMPPWAGILSAREAERIVQRLRGGLAHE